MDCNEVLNLIQAVDEAYTEELIKSGCDPEEALHICKQRIAAIKTVRINKFKERVFTTYKCYGCGAVYDHEVSYCDICGCRLDDR